MGSPAGAIKPQAVEAEAFGLPGHEPHGGERKAYGQQAESK